MDTLLRQGEHSVDGQGFPVSIGGTAELIQQAVIRLTVPRGSFALDPELGSLLHTLGQAAGKNLSDLAYQYARQALSGMSGISVEEASCARVGEGELEITVRLAAENGQTVLTLPING